MIVKIGQITEIIDGDRGNNYPKKSEIFDCGYCLFLDTGNVTPNGFSFQNNHFITEEKCNILRKGKLQRGDLVYTTRGTIGNIAYYGKSVPFNHIRINSGMVIFRVNAEICDVYYLYQLLKHPKYRKYMKMYCTGSAQPQLPIKNLSKIELDIPDLRIQHRIASILSAYDDLIENNQKQIKLLEEAAQRLYKEWFVDLRFPDYENTPVVDGVPEGWKRITIKDLSVLLRRGISPKYNDMAKYNVINQKCIRQTVMDIKESRKQEKSYLDEMNLQDSDIVICSTGSGTLGRVGQVFGQYPNTTFDSHVTLVRAKEEVGKQFLFQSLKYQQPLFMTLGQGSTNQLELSKRTIENYDIIYPTDKIVQDFEFITQPIHEKITALVNVVKSATEARDRLLPKLISGELEV